MATGKKQAAAAPKRSLQADLASSGIELDHHESDLYVRDTPEARAVLARHGKKVDGHNVSAFRGTDGHAWLDVPFAYSKSEPMRAAPAKVKKERAREPVDETAARELELYIENDYDLVGAPNSMGKNIERMLLKKVNKGKFDLLASVRAWMYLMDAGAKKYTKEFGSGSPIFNKPTREFVAARFAKEFAQEHAGQQVH